MDKKNITQRQLADAVGVSMRSVTYWCANTFQPKTKYWERIAQALGCSTKSLF